MLMFLVVVPAGGLVSGNLVEVAQGLFGLSSLPPSSLVADVGCGNGKYMQATYIGRPVALGRAFVGCDMSRNLVSICAKRDFNALVCDGLLLPYRDGAFDAAISIAVFHHIFRPAV